MNWGDFFTHDAREDVGRTQDGLSSKPRKESAMKRIIHDLVQGSAEWHKHRKAHLNASEAPAMVGISKYQSRADLLQQKATGIIPDVDAATEALFANGHQFEAQAREWAAEIIGAPLPPITVSAIVDGLPLSASYDGATADGDLIWEHKTLNASLARSLDAGEIPDQYKPQMVQQMLILGARKCLFMASNGDRESMRFAWYKSDASKQDRLIAAWKQFQTDLATYQHVEVLPPVMAAPVMALPALSIQVRGEISLVDNLKVFGAGLQAFITRLPEKPSTDQEFADCKAACKTLQEAQDALDAAEAHALGQIASFDEMKRTKALYFDLARNTRLAVEKMVAAREQTIKTEIVQAGKTAYAAHLAGLSKRLGGPYMPAIPESFAAVIKNKRTIASLHDAVDTELARVKIEASAAADRVELNLIELRERARGYEFLFSDTASLVLKDQDDLINLIKLRIAEHVAAEQKRLDAERERIRAEEQAKAQREAESKAAAERKAEQDAAERKRLDAEHAADTKTRQERAESELKRIANEQAHLKKMREEEETARQERDRLDGLKRAEEALRQEELDTDQLIAALYERIKGQKQYAGIAKAIDAYMGKQKKAA